MTVSVHKVRIGSRVQFTAQSTLTAMEGTVVALDLAPGKSVGVEFDYLENGHNCDGIAQKGHGWWCLDEELKLLSY